MKNAYGHNRDPKDFAHVPYDEARLFIDHNGTRDHLDELINRGGTRKGDVVYVLAVGDLGKGVAARKAVALIEDKGVSVVVCEPPEGSNPKPSVPRGRPAFRPDLFVDPDNPDFDLDATLREMWGNPIRYTQKYVLSYASEKMGKAITRNQMNHRYGNRYPKEGQEGA